MATFSKLSQGKVDLGRVAAYTLGGLVLVFVFMLAGLAAATASPILMAPFASLALGAILLMLPVPILLAALFAVGFVVIGAVMYFADIKQALWVPYFFGLLLYLRVMALVFVVDKTRTAIPAYVWYLFLFVLILAFSALVNATGPMQLLISSKSYLFLWSILFVCMLGIRTPATFLFLWKSLFVVAMFQVPMVIYQYAISGAHNWDAISGTLGGGENIGHSASMGFLLVAIFTLALALRREGLISKAMMLVVGFSCLVPIALAEIKAIVLLFFPLALILLYRRSVVREPVKFLGIGLFGAVVVTGVFMGYQHLHYERAGLNKTVIENFESTYELDADPHGIRQMTGELGRLALLRFWWEENGFKDPVKTLVGHGPGSFRVSSFYIGEVRLKYIHYKLDRHAASVLLWELGLLGFLAFLAILLSGAHASLRLAGKTSIPLEHRVLLNVGGIILLLNAAAVFYGRFMIDLASMQILLVFCLGQAAFWSRQGAQFPHHGLARSGPGTIPSTP